MSIDKTKRCGDVLRIGDDYGDNECTFHCTLEAGHEGPHHDEFEHEGKSVVVTWDADDSAVPIADDMTQLPLRQAEAPVSSIVTQASQEYADRDIGAFFFAF